MNVGEITVTPQTEKPYEVLMKHFLRSDKLLFGKEQVLHASDVDKAQAAGFWHLLREICFNGEKTAGLEYEVNNGVGLHIRINNPETSRAVSFHAVRMPERDGKYTARTYFHGNRIEKKEFPEKESSRVYRVLSKELASEALEHLLE